MDIAFKSSRKYFAPLKWVKLAQTIPAVSIATDQRYTQTFKGPELIRWTKPKVPQGLQEIF
jgi:hypothetical protein